ncbi:MAG: hypothetical protein ACR2QE_13155, partial [Acidimicrobiales bacterium]
MLCERAVEAAWDETDLDPFTERHLRWCGRCRRQHPQHRQLHATLQQLRDAFVDNDTARIEEIFAALDEVDRQRRQRTVA